MLNSGKINEALSFTSIYDVFGDSADFKFLMRLIYMKNVMFSEAVNEFEKAAQYRECRVEGVNSYLAYYNTGVVYECLGNEQKAKKYPDMIAAVHLDENGRQGRARNIGLEYARGEYIGYVDSDDW